MTACLFYFLLLPIDNDKEARMSLYPATPNVSLIICFGTANDSVPYLFFIATHIQQHRQGGKVILVPRRPRRTLMPALLSILICISGASNERVLFIFIATDP